MHAADLQYGQGNGYVCLELACAILWIQAHREDPNAVVCVLQEAQQRVLLASLGQWASPRLALVCFVAHVARQPAGGRTRLGKDINIGHRTDGATCFTGERPDKERLGYRVRRYTGGETTRTSAA